MPGEAQPIRQPLHRRASAERVAMASAIPPARMADTEVPLEDLKTPVKRASARIIRTFEEIEVEKRILQEEWYEELECGICAHVIGAAQALVPCGHSFCGPCAWQWIIVNKNYTCPHCRMQILPDNPLVPNIIVEQIVDRKLRGLPEGKQKKDLLREREETSQSWKILQAEMPSKPKRKTKGFDEWFGILSGSGTEGAEGHRRRASRHLMELGAPIAAERRTTPILTAGGMSLGAIRRLEAEEAASNPTAPSVPNPDSRPSSLRPQATAPRSTRAPLVIHSPSPPPVRSLIVFPSPRPEPIRAHSSPLNRAIAPRSSVLAARQARGQTRDNPLVVPPDTDSE